MTTVEQSYLERPAALSCDVFVWIFVVDPCSEHFPEEPGNLEELDDYLPGEGGTARAIIWCRDIDLPDLYELVFWIDTRDFLLALFTRCISELAYFKRIQRVSLGRPGSAVQTLR